MLLVCLCCLFVFLGMYIGNKYDLRNVSINSIFGLFLINGIFNIFFGSYSMLSYNYHDTTFIYVILGIVIGFSLMKIIGYKYDETDNLTIAGFTMFNSYLLFVSKFNILFLIINILYYILIGLYITKSKSWISVFIGMVLGLLFSLTSSWIFGYVFTFVLGFILYFIVSVYTIVFKNNSKMGYYALICGVLVALIGAIL